MGFPDTLNPQAIRQVVRFIAKQDTDKGRLALAAYEIEGYALHLMFPGAAYIQDGLITEMQLDTSRNQIAEAFVKELATSAAIDWAKIFHDLKPIIGPILLKILTDVLLK